MDAVARIGCNIDGTVETEGHIRSVDIIIDGFRKMDNIQSFLTKQVGRLLCTVTAKNDQTIQPKLVIILLHCFYLVQSVLIRFAHQLERSTAAAKDRSAHC